MLLRQCEELIGLALKAGADAAEAFCLREEGTSFSIEKDTIAFSSCGIDFGVGLRVLKDDRMGFAFCTDAQQFDPVVRQAIAAAKLSPKQPFTFPDTDRASVPSIADLYDPAILALTPEAGLESCERLVAAVKTENEALTVTGGGFGYGHSQVAIANSNGVAIEERGTAVYGGVSSVLREKVTSTGFESDVLRAGKLDLDAIGKTAGKIATAGQDQVPGSDGQMTIILTPEAFGSMLEFMTIPALYSENADRGESVYSGKIGTAVMAESLSCFEDASMPNGIHSSGVDDEGVPSKRLPVIENGVLRSFLYDQRTALAQRQVSTSCGVRCEKWSTSRGFKSPPGTKSRNFIVEPAVDAGKGTGQSLDELIGTTPDGLLLYNTIGAHTANIASGDFSVGSSVLFRIQNGELKGAVKSIMLAGNFPECLKRISGIGKNFKRVTGTLSPVGMYVPSVRIENVRVMG